MTIRLLWKTVVGMACIRLLFLCLSIVILVIWCTFRLLCMMRIIVRRLVVIRVRILLWPNLVGTVSDLNWVGILEVSPVRIAL